MKLSSGKYPAYPLIACDPYFSVWSMCDELTGDFTRHWTGKQHSMTGIITVDGVAKTFMGRMCHNPSINLFGPKPIEQKSVSVTPLKTIYTFSDEKIELEVCFITPLLLNDIKLLSRPVSYIAYSIKSIDKKEHNISVYIDVSALLAVNTPDESVIFNKTDISVCCSSGKANMLLKSGDDLRINWGHLHLSAKSGKLGVTCDNIKGAVHRGKPTPKTDIFRREIKACGDNKNSYPVMYFTNEYNVNDTAISDFVCIGYDDIHSIEYFGEQIDAFYKKDGESFLDALKDSLVNFDDIIKKVNIFDEKIITDALSVSEDYAKLLSIAYRQTIAAHKLAWDGHKAVFVSKECYSNGCAATVDVTYPSIPLFLIYNADLVEYMLNPIFDLIDNGLWRYEFAPHDAGQYPLLNGQVYGLVADELKDSMQMPIEECGNMILCVAALCRAKGNAQYAREHFDILKQWADYLVKYGLDPNNQLCTDDFAGRLAHNCNLSVKAIMGIAAWGMLLSMMDNEEEGKAYLNKARDFAGKWKQQANDGDHYRLAFDQENTWSIKYNLVWDKLFGLNIFDSDIFETEVSYYKARINKYGIPLDSREDYTKSDWQLWSTVLSDDTEYSDRIVSAMLTMLSETNDRVPFCDFYYSSTAIHRAFQNRTVQGGLFIKLLRFDSRTR